MNDNVYPKLVILFALLLIVAVGFAACAPSVEIAPETPPVEEVGDTPVTEEEVEPPDSGELHIGYVSETLTNPFFSTVAENAEARAAELGIRLTILGSEDITDQVKNAEDLIQQEVDVLVLTPWDGQGVIPVVEKANAAGIPVITVDQTAAGGEIATYIATDNVLGGKLAGQWLAENLGDKGKIAILEGAPGSTSNNDRLEGFNSVLKDYPDIEIVASVPADWRRDQGLQVMSDILTGNPELDGVMALNDEMALGALEAIKAAGRQDEIILVGYNGAAEAIQSVYDGGLAADVIQYPEVMGQLMITWGIRLTEGETPAPRINPGVAVYDTKGLQKAARIILE